MIDAYLTLDGTGLWPGDLDVDEEIQAFGEAQRALDGTLHASVYGRKAVFSVRWDLIPASPPGGLGGRDFLRQCYAAGGTHTLVVDEAGTDRSYSVYFAEYRERKVLRASEGWLYAVEAVFEEV